MIMSDQSFPQNYFGSRTTNEVPSKEFLEKTLTRGKRPLVKFIQSLPDKARVLDAGCGTAKGIKLIIAYRPDIEVIGLDISQTERFIPQEIKFVRGSVEEADKLFPADSFDAIICLHVLEHLAYPMKTITAFKKVLKNNGLLYLEVPNWPRLINPLSDKFFWNDYTHIRPFTKRAVARLMEDFAFIVKEIKTMVSGSLIEGTDTVANAKKLYQEKAMTPAIFIKKALRMMLMRLMNVMIRGIILAVAVNKK